LHGTDAAPRRYQVTELPRVRPQVTEYQVFRQGAEARGLIRGKRWLRLRRWANLDREERQTLRDLFALNRRLAKAYLLKEQLAQLWTYTYEGRPAASPPTGLSPSAGSGCRPSKSSVGC
jgi:hypothetical protein